MNNFSWKKTGLLLSLFCLIVTFLAIKFYFLNFKGTEAREILYRVYKAGNTTIYSINENGKEEKVSDFSSGRIVSVSPDKRKIIYVKPEDTPVNSRIYVKDLVTSKEQVYPVNNEGYLMPGDSFIWNPDSKKALIILSLVDKKGIVSGLNFTKPVSRSLVILDTGKNLIENVDISDQQIKYVLNSFSVSFIKSDYNKVYILAYGGYIGEGRSSILYYTFDWKKHNIEDLFSQDKYNLIVSDIDSTGKKVLGSNGDWGQLMEYPETEGKLQVYNLADGSMRLIVSKSGFTFPQEAKFISDNLILYSQTPIPTNAQSATYGFRNSKKWYLFSLSDNKQTEVLSVDNEGEYLLKPINEKKGLIQYLHKGDYRLNILDFKTGEITNIYQSQKPDFALIKTF